MPGKVFVNYRRGDDAGFTQALYQRLEDEFTANNLFMDVEGHIKPGDDFVETLSAQVAAADVLLVVIGPRWLELLAARGGASDDFVAIEIKAALDSSKRVIPVLVGGAQMPSAEVLPEQIRMLSRRNAVGLRPERFRSDCQGLVTALKESLVAAENERTARSHAERAAALADRQRAEAEAAAQIVLAEKRARAQALAGLSANEIRKAEELANWDFIKSRDQPQELRNHLARFPEGITALYALTRLEELEWTNLGNAPSIHALTSFVDEFPNGANSLVAQARLAMLEKAAAGAAKIEQRWAQETAEWQAVAASADIAVLNKFLNDWPKGQHAKAARILIKKLRGGGFIRRGLIKTVTAAKGFVGALTTVWSWIKRLSGVCFARGSFFNKLARGVGAVLVLVSLLWWSNENILCGGGQHWRECVAQFSNADEAERYIARQYLQLEVGERQSKLASDLKEAEAMDSANAVHAINALLILHKKATADTQQIQASLQRLGMNEHDAEGTFGPKTDKSWQRYVTLKSNFERKVCSDRRDANVTVGKPTINDVVEDGILASIYAKEFSRWFQFRPVQQLRSSERIKVELDDQLALPCNAWEFRNFLRKYGEQSLLIGAGDETSGANTQRTKQIARIANVRALDLWEASFRLVALDILQLDRVSTSSRLFEREADRSSDLRGSLVIFRKLRREESQLPGATLTDRDLEALRTLSKDIIELCANDLTALGFLDSGPVAGNLDKLYEATAQFQASTSSSFPYPSVLRMTTTARGFLTAQTRDVLRKYANTQRGRQPERSRKPPGVNAPASNVGKETLSAEAEAKRQGDLAAKTKRDLEARLAAEAASSAKSNVADGVSLGIQQVVQTFRDCSDGCPQMVIVPAGEFLMGSGDNDNEAPPHRVTIRQPFAVGKFEVTFAEWDACASGGGCPSNKRPSDQGWGRGNRPVMNVSWNDAKEYVAWLTGKTGKAYRLLSEAEWEYAARAGTTNRYAFGDTISNSQAQFSANRTVDVGSFPANAFGLHDMHGNVWEWCEDAWHSNYKAAPDDGSSWAGGDGSSRIMRGGSFTIDLKYLTSAFRNSIRPDYRYENIGFRVARTM